MLKPRMILTPLLGGAVFIPVAVLTACGDKGVSIGSNSEEVRNVDPLTIASAVTSCGSVQAHPNVCCKGDANEPSSCVAYVNSPFHRCEEGWALYPDPTSCCDLSDPSKCVAPPSPPTPAPAPSGCGYACAPGWWPVVNSPGECCQLLPTRNALECTQSDWGGTPVPIDAGSPWPGDASIEDAGPMADAWTEPDADTIPDGGTPIPAWDGGVYPVDGGAEPPPWSWDGGVYPVDGGAEPPPWSWDDGGYYVDGGGPVCDAGSPLPPPVWPQPVCNLPCPPGFASLSSDPSVCCSTAPTGARSICFSQATGTAFPIRSKTSK